MRVLAITPRAYLGDIFLSLAREGHEVRVHAFDPPEERAFGGLIETVADWRDHLAWAGRDGVVLFEGVGQGALQDSLRAEGYRVVGGSAFGDRLELDRGFGQAVLAEAGLPTAWCQPFADGASAAAWLRANPGRYVVKYQDNGSSTFVGEHPTGADLLFVLSRRPGPVLLMERLDGVEVGIGAYFDGHRFLRPACIDFEHKRFFPGDLGEMTGEMGTLASYEGAERLHAATLARVAPRLAAAGHVGYVNLNLMVDERGTFPLEFTCRIGNPGFAVLAALQPDGWGDLLARMTRQADGPFRTGSFRATPGWSVAIVLTVWPFPGILPDDPDDDPPVFFHRAPDADRAAYHYVDMRRDGPQLLARRRSGHVMIVTGTGGTIPLAQAAAAARARNVVVPDLRWRHDIGDRVLHGEAGILHRLGWL